WQGGRSPRGYGKVWFESVEWRAHRLIFFLTNGWAPLAVCHTCDTPPCCNPRHLFGGTNADNNTDRANKHRSVSPCGETHPQAKLTNEDVVAMRRVYTAGGVSQRALGQAFGVRQATVEYILKLRLC